jgi:hypothetical protein
VTAEIAVTAAPTITIEATSEATSEATTEATLEATAATPPSMNLLAPFFGDGVFVRLEPDDLAELDAFLAETGLNFAVLGE